MRCIGYAECPDVCSLGLFAVTVIVGAHGRERRLDPLGRGKPHRLSVGRPPENLWLINREQRRCGEMLGSTAAPNGHVFPIGQSTTPDVSKS